MPIAVYYEALCPDSQAFFINQLRPACYRLPNEVVQTIQLIPFGKATMLANKRGSFDFVCDHGPRECFANKIHACVIRRLPQGYGRSPCP